ncbi:MAG: hypothetical protein Q4C89_10160 [Deinococcus sp.]|uniref:hypothetical protein n=1 Tax=Deinococcus sp. TaxID=47478 RepID=UPI0026DC16F0|nr:hypothetical protein [Deinococcus sp.]MDO4246375.1 hypothetical protein [Deinococcus sp.]
MNDTIKMIVGGQRVTLRLTGNDHGLRKTWEGSFMGGRLKVIETYYDKEGVDAVRYEVEVTRSFAPVGKPGFHLGATLQEASTFFNLDMAVDDSTDKQDQEDMPF